MNEAFGRGRGIGDPTAVIAYQAHNDYVYSAGDMVAMGDDGYLMRAVPGRPMLGIVIGVTLNKLPVDKDWERLYEQEFAARKVSL